MISCVRLVCAHYLISLWYCFFSRYQDLNGHCWNNECPRCPVFDVDSFDPKDENALMRVPVAPFANASITTLLCIPKEDLSRKRKRRSLDTIPAGVAGRNQADAEQFTSPTSESKKAMRDATKSKKNPTTSTDKDEKTARKKPGKASADQGEPKRSKAVAKKAKQKKTSRTEAPSTLTEAAETGEASPISTFPHYDSVFSR